MNNTIQYQTTTEANYTAPVQQNVLALTAQQRCSVLQTRLKQLQSQDKRWGYKYAADLSGLTEVTVRHIVTDPEYDPRISSLQDLCRVLGCMMDPDVVYLDRPETLELLAAKDSEIERLAASVARLDETVSRLRNDIDFHVKEAEMKSRVIEKLLSV